MKLFYIVMVTGMGALLIQVILRSLFGWPTWITIPFAIVVSLASAVNGAEKKYGRGETA